MTWPESLAGGADAVGLAWHPGELIEGLYEVLEVVERSGPVSAYRVRHRGWGTDLAVMAPGPEIAASAERLHDFEVQAEAWVGMGWHPHTVRCVHVQRIGGIPRLFAEWVDGGSLADWLRDGRLYEGGPQAVMERMVDVAIQCAWGLEHAHAEGLTHHDAKPANVMLSRDGTVKVTHPGLAGTTGASGLRSWALSVLEMLTGGRALDADATGREALVALARGGPADPRLPPVPASLLSLLRRCLQPDPADRHATIGQVAEALIDLHADTFGTRYPRARPEDVILPADALCNQALSMLELGRRERADALWDLALQADPRHLHSLYNRGLDRWRRERMSDEQLVAELAACLGDGCDEPAAGHLLARVHLERGDSESALAVLDEAVRAAPADEHVHEAIELARRHVATRGPQSLLIHDKRLTAAALTADGRLALTGCDDGTLRMWQLRGGGVVRTLPAHESSVRSIALSCDGERAVSADSNGVVRAWDVLQERCMHMAQTGVERPAIALSGDGRVVVYSAPGTVRVWEPASGRDTRTIVCPAVMALALSADGRRAVSAGSDGQLRVWDIPAGRCLRAITAGTAYVVGSTVALSADGSYALSGAVGRGVKVWELSSVAAWASSRDPGCGG